MEERYFSKSDDRRFKIIMVGDPNVGKTTLFWQYIEGEFLAEKSGACTTIDFKIKEVKVDEDKIKIYIWDTAGQEKYRSIVATYFKGCDGVILMFDLTHPESLTNVITKWYELAKSKAPEAHMMLVGNKSDLEVKVDEKRAEQWAKMRGIQYLRTSVRNNENIDKCFEDMTRKIYRNPPVTRAESFTLKKKALSGGGKQLEHHCCG